MLDLSKEKKINASKVGLGTWKILEKNSLREVKKIIEIALDMGINVYDTAQVYSGGKAEELLGKLKKDYPKLQISTKLPGRIRPTSNIRLEKIYSRSYLEEKMEVTLRNLKNGYVDFLMLHNWSFDWGLDEMGSVLETLYEFKKEELAKFIGVSLPKWSLLDKNVDFPFEAIDFVQVPYNLSQQWAKYFIEKCSQKGVYVFSRTVFGSGKFSNKNQEVATPEIKKILSKLDIQNFELPLHAFLFSFLNSNIDTTLVGINSQESLFLLKEYIKEPITLEKFGPIDGFNWKYE